MIPHISTQTAYSEIERLVARFKGLSAAARRGYNEDNTRKDFILPLFRALEWDVTDSAEVSAEEKVSRGWVDFSFRIGGVPRFFLETKRVSEDLTKPQWVQQAMDYAWTKGVTWALLSDFEGLRVFNAEWKEDNPLRAQFIEFGVDSYLADFERLRWLSRPEIAAGRLDHEAEKVGKKARREPVSQHLFDDLKSWRQILFKNLHVYNPQWSAGQIDEAVLRILNRLIFIRTAEDRLVEERRLLPLLRELKDQKRGGQLLPELRKLWREFDATYDSQLFEPHRADILACGASPFEVLIEGLYGKQFLLYNFNAIDADVLGTAYEQYLGHIITGTSASLSASPGAVEVVEKRAKRKSQGIFYTPTFVVKYIVQQTVGRYLDEYGYHPSQPVRVLDMACGSGSFLIEAFDVLDRYVAEMRGDLGPRPALLSGEGEYDLRGHARQMELLTQCIYGVDKDEQAVAVARLNLLLKALHTRDKLPPLEHIRCGDSLISGAADELAAAFGPDWRSKRPFNWQEEFPEVFRGGGLSAGSGQGFDVIVGNPPYVRIQTLPKNDVTFFNERYAAATGNYDIYVLFVERALQMLKPGGVLGFILPNKFMQVDYGAGLRKLLSENRYVAGIVDFKEFQVFEGATTYTCLLFLKKQACPEFEVLAVDSHAEERSSAVFAGASRSGLPAGALSSDAWALSDTGARRLLEKLRSAQATPLLELPAQMSRGSSSGADEVFILEETGLGAFRANDGTLFEIEPEILRTPIYATDFGRYIFRPKARERIIFPYEVAMNGYRLLEEDAIKSRFPKAFGYLLSRREQLESRKDYRTWYAFSAPRNLNTHDSAQLVVPLLADHGVFTLLPEVKEGFCLMASGGFSISTRECDLSPKYLLGLLNSTLLFWNLRQVSNVFRGGWITCTKQYVGQLPIRRINFADPADVARHDRIVALVDEMLALQPQLAAAERGLDDARHDLARRSARVDREIDGLVYKLYGLTEEEVRIVEER